MPDQPARQHLAQAIRSLTEADANLARLRSALERASAELSQLDSQLIDARAAQAQAGREGQRARALAYADSGEVEQRDVPEAAAAAVLDSLTSLHQKRAEIAANLSKEIVTAQRRLEIAQRAVISAVAAVVESSEEFRSLLDSISAAWVRLRTLKIALDSIVKSCRGNASDEAYKVLNRTEPLIRDLAGFPWDAKLVDSWEEAVARLALDANAALPGKADA